MPGGRPTTYEDFKLVSFPQMAYVACLEGGFTDVKLAKLFNCNADTIYEWKKDHPEFSEAIKKGKLEHDNSAVVDSLLKRALGYDFTETTRERGLIPEYKEEKDPDNPDVTIRIPIGFPKMVITKKVKKHLAADVKAIELWLTNRHREIDPDTGLPMWMRISYKAIELTGKGGGPLLLPEIAIRFLAPGEKSPDTENESD